MWSVCFTLSVVSLAASVCLPVLINLLNKKAGKKISKFKCAFAGVLFAAFFMFMPAHAEIAGDTFLGGVQTFFMSVFTAMQIFTLGTEYGVIGDYISNCPETLTGIYLVWVTFIYVLAPVFTFGAVLSLFKNASAYFSYLRGFFKDVYIFSDLNNKSLALASDLKRNHKNALIVFTDVFDEGEDESDEIVGEALSIGALCFKKDITAVNFSRHSKKREIYFFTIGKDEFENTVKAGHIIDRYRDRDNTHLYVLSNAIESELLFSARKDCKIKVRRINEVRSLINRDLYENGISLFENARYTDSGKKKISAVVVGMGLHGTEMVKALAWFGQMDKYEIEINAFDKDVLAEERFVALAPELMSDKYNGKYIEGEAYYKIAVHSGIDTESATFTREIEKIKDATFALVSLGDDGRNIKTAVNLRMHFERMGIHPTIKAVVYNSKQKQALDSITNFKNQPYDIEFIGDDESSYTESVILDSELERKALACHLGWGEEKDFWSYEYHYRSSMASAIHLKARVDLGIIGADKKESEMTDVEREIVESVEHKRWNAYMRSEGYVHGEKRNDLAKVHHLLVEFAALDDEQKRKDSSVGSVK